MLTMEEIARGVTLAEATGMTEELGRFIARLAAGEMAAGRLDTAREILEGLAVTNPRDAAAWALLAQVERRQGRVEAAWLCAEAAARLAPEDEQVRLVRAEVLLALPDEGERARSELSALAATPGPVGARARALVQALGP